jgi:hypothetical protein
VTNEGGGGFNNAVWFWSQSKLVAWVFAVEALWGLLRGRGRLVQGLVLGLAVAVSVPSTVQHLARQMESRPRALDPRAAGLVSFLDRLCTRGEVVFSHDALATILVTMTRCRAPLQGDFAILTSGPELARRRADMQEFWNPRNTPEARAEILRRYDAAYLVVEKAADDASPLWPFLVGRPLFENEAFALYLVRRPHSRGME